MNTLASRVKSTSFDWLTLLLVLLTVAGLGVSAYLMWGYTVPGATLSCGGSSGCETVKNSIYANFLGIPLPVVGLGVYSALLMLIAAQNHPAVTKKGWVPYIALAIFGISFTGVLYSAYLTYIELYVIYAICRWCIASAVIMVVIFFLSIFNLQKSNQH